MNTLITISLLSFLIGSFLFSAFQAVLSVYRLFARWQDNNRQPLQTRKARLVEKRANTWLVGSIIPIMPFYAASSYYQGVFEVGISGQRLVFRLSTTAFAMMEEGEFGELSFRGTRFLQFKACEHPAKESQRPLVRAA
jgi:hypothetical protein